jgi:hypothetical protein
MRRALREWTPSALTAALGCGVLGWLALYGFAWNDYDNEARPAVEALIHGHVAEFLRVAPAYGGSLIERAPFALLPSLWGGGALAVYRMMALPCLLAVALLGVWLLVRMRARGYSTSARALAMVVCVANPLTVRALELGHPEELLGASLCVAAVMLAADASQRPSRAIAAGALLGLAIANKEWALLAAGPVLLAMPARRRAVAAITAAATGAAVLAPLAVVGSGSFVTATKGLASAPSPIFQPWQLWWFLGHHGALVHGLFGEAKPGYRLGPAWIESHTHLLVLLAGAVVTLGLWLRRRPRALTVGEALLALSLLLLVRCLLDTWDTVYYPLPFLLALLAWEVHGGARRMPLLALSCTGLAWLDFQWLPGHVSPDLQAGLFLVWTVPLAVWLAARAFGAPRPAAAVDPIWPAQGAPQEMTVSSLGRLVRTS